MKMRGGMFSGFLILILSAATAAWAEDICSEPVKTAAGLVSGHEDAQTATCFWKGIPYAAPPEGELRFRAPQPKPAWSGVLDAGSYGDQCMQVLAGDKARKHMSEDCLYLNVWRPKQSGSFPVMAQHQDNLLNPGSAQMVENMLHEEAKEGIGAFLEKRQPRWPR